MYYLTSPCFAFSYFALPRLALSCLPCLASACFAKPCLVLIRLAVLRFAYSLLMINCRSRAGLRFAVPVFSEIFVRALQQHVFRPFTDIRS